MDIWEEILTDYETRTTIKLSEVLPNCWKIRDLKSIDNFVKELKEILL